jgi:hypothetical protein
VSITQIKEVIVNNLATLDMKHPLPRLRFQGLKKKAACVEKDKQPRRGNEM